MPLSRSIPKCRVLPALVALLLPLVLSLAPRAASADTAWEVSARIFVRNPQDTGAGARDEPYLRVTSPGSGLRSGARVNVRPVWRNDYTEFEAVNLYFGDYLKVDVWEEDNRGSDDKLGTFILERTGDPDVFRLFMGSPSGNDYDECQYYPYGSGWVYCPTIWLDGRNYEYDIQLRFRETEWRNAAPPPPPPPIPDPPPPPGGVIR